MRSTSLPSTSTVIPQWASQSLHCRWTVSTVMRSASQNAAPLASRARWRTRARGDCAQVPWRRAGARPTGCVGAVSVGAAGIEAVTGASEPTVSSSPRVGDVQWRTVEQREPDLALLDLDLQPAPGEGDAEGETRKRLRQPRPEGQLPVVVAHAAEAGNRTVQPPASEAMCSPCPGCGAGSAGRSERASAQ